MTLDVPITVEGKVLGDPTTEVDMNGYRLVHFGLLIEPRPKDGPVDLTAFFQTEIPDVVTKSELAVNVRRSLRAGDLVLVSGLLRVSRWTDWMTGHERSHLELAASDVAPSLRFRPAYIGRRHYPVDRSADVATVQPRPTGSGLAR